MKLVFTKFLVLAMGTFLLAACGSGGGSSSAATPVGALSLNGQNASIVGNGFIGENLFSGPLTVTNWDLLSSYLQGERKCIYGTCAAPVRIVTLQISTMPDGSCVRHGFAGMLPGWLSVSLTSGVNRGGFGNPGVQHCKRGFFNSLSGVTINFLPQMYQPGLPGLQQVGYQIPGQIPGQYPGQFQGGYSGINTQVPNGLQIVTGKAGPYAMNAAIYVNNIQVAGGTISIIDVNGPGY